MTNVPQHPSTVEYLETLRQALQRQAAQDAAACKFQLRPTPKAQPVEPVVVQAEPTPDAPPAMDTTLRQLAAQAKARYAGEAARIDRALVIALNGGVTVHADSTADVQSASDPEVVYHVAHGTCDCPDFERAPDGRCKHRYAVCLVKKATTAAAYYTSTTDSQGLVLGGHKATADAKRAEEEAAGGLVAIICGYGKGR